MAKVPAGMLMVSMTGRVAIKGFVGPELLVQPDIIIAVIVDIQANKPVLKISDLYFEYARYWGKNTQSPRLQLV
jgi:hypothetical protein